MSQVELVVAGAHLSGFPLNHQLTELDAVRVKVARTAPVYRLFALPTTPPKPGLVRVGRAVTGGSIEVEVWRLDSAALGAFMSHVVAPLAIGRVELDDGSTPLGFLCEPHAIEEARDITASGGWRAASVDL
jgi:allophanate hydrolase